MPVKINLCVLVTALNMMTTGKVVRGPAPLSLALAHADVTEDDKLVFSHLDRN